MAERMHPNEQVKQEIAHAVQKRLDDWQIKEVWFDVDGTLVDTTVHYRQRMHQAIAWLFYNQPIAEIKRPEQLKIIEDYNQAFIEKIRANRAQYCVHPDVMYTALADFVKNCCQFSCQRTKRYQKAVEEIGQIYHGPCPLPLPGAKPKVEIIGLTQCRVKTASHSDLSWTIRKIREGEFPEFDGHVTFDTLRSKYHQWQEQVEKEKVSPEQILIIGDNPTADFALLENGARGIWINSRNQQISERLLPYLKSGHLLVVSSPQEVIPALIGYI